MDLKYFILVVVFYSVNSFLHNSNLLPISLWKKAFQKNVFYSTNDDERVEREREREREISNKYNSLFKSEKKEEKE
mgnify:CR=1 FL=1